VSWGWRSCSAGSSSSSRSPSAPGSPPSSSPAAPRSCPAGSICWHQGGSTDSYGLELRAFTDGLGWLPYSNGVHDDLADQPRRERYRTAVATGELPPGHATEDGVGLHYVGTELAEAVTVVPGARAWRVHRGGAEPLGTRLLAHSATT